MARHSSIPGVLNLFKTVSRVFSYSLNRTVRLTLLGITETRPRARTALTRSVTADLTSSQPRNLLSMATLKKAKSRRLPANSNRARVVQTCFGSKGSFCPMIRPLYQALRVGVTASSRTLGMICLPILPPRPFISTAPTCLYYKKALNGACLRQTEHMASLLHWAACEP